jgi:hypothetical protein
VRHIVMQTAFPVPALVEQTLNPVFTPAKGPADRTPRFDLFSPMRGSTWAEEFDSPFAPSPLPVPSAPTHSSSPLYSVSPIRFSVTKATAVDADPPRQPPAYRAREPGPLARTVARVRYTFDHLWRLCESPLVAATVRLPDALGWLDKRVDLEDDIEDEGDHAPELDLRSPVNQRFLGSPYDYAPITPRRATQAPPPAFDGPPPGPIGTPTRVMPQRPRVDSHHSPYHPILAGTRTPPPQSRPPRRASIGGVLPDPADVRATPSTHRTPLKQITRAIGKAATAPRRRPTLMTAEALAADKENLPPSLFWTPPRRPCDTNDDDVSLYSRLVGFL